MKLDRLGFAVGTGRCGTQFIVRLLELEPAVAASHERNAVNETFHRYCIWHRLPVDDEGFLQTKEKEIAADLRRRDFSFEASACLSLSVTHLFERFGARFILLARDPADVVNSFFAKKDVYEIEYQRKNPNLAVGYHKMEPHHFFGRTVPNGDEFLHWKDLTRVGKLAWLWEAINARVLEQFRRIPATHSMALKLEDFDYQKYLEIGDFFGIKLTLGENRFNEISASRPNNLDKKSRKLEDWNQKELADFVQEMKDACKTLGYHKDWEKLWRSRKKAI